jgi:hypothetical protein
MDHLGAELPYRLSTGDLEFQNPNVAPGGGEQFWHIRKIIPDYDRERGTTGTHDLTIESRGYPMRSPATKGPYRYGDNQVVADHFAVRARGRTLRFKFSGAGDFRMGTLRGMVTPNGGSE